MGGFTRLLHSGKADDLMDEIPTVVVDPLPSSLVEHNWWVLHAGRAGVGWEVETATLGGQCLSSIYQQYPGGSLVSFVDGVPTVVVDPVPSSLVERSWWALRAGGAGVGRRKRGNASGEEDGGVRGRRGEEVSRRRSWSDEPGA